MKQLNDIELEPFYIEDEEYKDLMLRTLLEPGEIIVQSHIIDEVQLNLEAILYRIQYYNDPPNIEALLETLIDDLKFIKIGARP